MKAKSKSKKVSKRIISLIIVIAVIVFIALYFVFNYSEPNVLDSKDKKWVTDNGSKVIDIDILNNIPLYANDGKGVVYNFIDYIKDETTLDFNLVSFIDTEEKLEHDYHFEFIDGSKNLDSNQLLIFTDSYVLISKSDMKINKLSDIDSKKVGVLKEDSENISYYLNSLKTVEVYASGDLDSTFKALDDGTVEVIIVPNISTLDRTINSDYYINYYLTDLVKNYVLTMDKKNSSLNTILTKCYNKYFDKMFTDEYNELFLNYYVEQTGINDKTKAELLSKTYVYGYVDNLPYESKVANSMEGIAIEYVKRNVRLTNIEVEYKKYDSVKELKKAIDKNKVDIYFDYFGKTNDNYLETKSVFIENFVILGKYDQNAIISSLESLKGKNVVTLESNYLYKYLENNTKANIATVKKTKDLIKGDKLIIVDKEVYNYYRNSLFKDYDILYSDIMSYDYRFMIKSDNESFFKLFDYVINTNSYYNYRNIAYNNLSEGIFNKVSFEELYLIILLIILVPLIIIGIVFLILKNKHKLTILRKEDRKKYTDQLTSLKNRNYLNLNIERWEDCKVFPQTLMIVYVNGLKHVNNNYGRSKGDNLIIKAASVLINTQLENTEIVRTDGNEFLIYLVGYTEKQIIAYLRKLSKQLLPILKPSLRPYKSKSRRT